MFNLTNNIFLNSIKCEFKKVFNRKEFYIIVTLCILIGVSATLFQIGTSNNYMIGNIPMAAVMSMVNGEMILGSLYSWVIMPVFITVICGDSFCVEQNLGCHKLFIIKSSRKDYFISKAIAIIVISFFIAILPFIISELLSIMAFPIRSNVINTAFFSAYDNLNLKISGRPLFNNLYLNYRYLNNIIIILFNGIVGMGIGLFTYVVSLYFKFKKTLICAICSSIYITLTFILGNVDDAFFLYNYLGSVTGERINILFYIIFNLIIFILCILGIRNKILKNKDLF